MIGLRVLFIAAFIALLSPDVMAGPSPADVRYLAGRAVKWEDNRLAGDLRNVPVKGLLVELLQTDGFKWEVIGNLTGQVTVSLDALTLEQSIRKVLKSIRYSYTLIQTPPDLSGSSNPPRFDRLTVYQDDKITRFSRTEQKMRFPHQGLATRETVPRAVSTPVATAKEAPHTSAPPLPAGPEVSAKDLERVDKEIKDFLDGLLEEQQISAQEYDQVLKEMRKKKE